MEYNSGSNRASNFKIIKSRITPELYNTKSYLLINGNYNKIREEYNGSINYLTG